MLRSNARTPALVLAAVAVTVYALMWLGYRMQWPWLDAIDQWALRVAYDYGINHPGWVRCWDVVCTVFGPAGFRLFGVVVIVVALRRRNVRAAVFVLTTIGLSGVVIQLAKNLADRPRPAGALAAAMSTAFPSGHAVAVMAAVLALLTLSAGLFGPRVRAATIVAGALVVAVVGVGRVVLTVHQPSDVIAGWALGYLWFLVWLVVIRPVSDEAADGKPEAPGTSN